MSGSGHSPSSQCGVARSPADHWSSPYLTCLPGPPHLITTSHRSVNKVRSEIEICTAVVIQSLCFKSIFEISPLLDWAGVFCIFVFL